MWERIKIAYIEPIPNGNSDARIFFLRFHKAQDHVFDNSSLAADRVIITEDGDYGGHGESEKADGYTYITKELGVQLFRASDFCKVFT